MKAVTLCAVLCLAPIAQAFAASCPAPASQMARTELLFGAGHVSSAQWKAFLSKEVTPRFPYGLTVLDGYGQWQGPGGHIAKEKSHVLLIWHGLDQSSKIDAIRDAYKQRFHQQSVMRVDSEDCVSF
ncbi:MAG TPA: DUF3574 domain-containing protein [Rhizomicrobium sp.]|jgi:hypothetical protein